MEDKDPYGKYADFEGPTTDELKAAWSQYVWPTKQTGGGSTQFSGQNFIGTPRKAKHRGFKVNGVRIS